MATAELKDADNEIDDHTKPPFLRRVRIRGYKSIAFCDVTLEPLTVLVGRNGAGKSNFLDALAFLRDAMDISVTEAVKRRGGWSSIACRPADTPHIEIEVNLKYTHGDSETKASLKGRSFSASYLLQLSDGELGPPVIEHESLDFLTNKGKKNGLKTESGLRFITDAPHPISSWYPAPADEPPLIAALAMHRSDHCLLGAIRRRPFIDLADALRSMVFNNMQPGSVRHPQPTSNGSLLEKHGSNLASVIRCLKDIDPASLNRVKQYVCHIVDEVSDFWVEAIGEYETIRFRMRSERAGKPVEFDARSMSDGTLRVLANIMAAFQNVPPYGHPSVVGIEEPETALHPAAMHALVDALRDATQHTQILITTHSADLLDDRYLDPAQILVVRSRNGQTEIAPIGPAGKEIVAKELYGLGDLQRMDHLEPDEEYLRRQTPDANGKTEKP